MSTLGLDYGTRRIGVAYSDDVTGIATPVGFIDAEPFLEAAGKIKELVREKEVERIVVGVPRNMNGTYGPAAQAVFEFVENLKRVVLIPIVTWDERLTSVAANRVLIEEGNVRRDKRKTKVDQIAAQMILQSFLDAEAFRQFPKSGE